MADIDVQRKEGSIWPWVLGLLVLALLVWGIVEMVGDDGLDDADTVATTEGVIPPGETAPGQAEGELAGLAAPLQGYIRDCTATAGDEPAEMGREHKFTINCLEQLGSSIRAVSGERSTEAMQTHMAEFDASVESLRGSEASSTQHANFVTQAATHAQEAIDALQEANGVEGGESLQNAVSEVGKSTQLLEQRQAVRDFFRQAGDALRNIATQQGTAPAR